MRVKCRAGRGSERGPEQPRGRRRRNMHTRGQSALVLVLNKASGSLGVHLDDNFAGLDVDADLVFTASRAAARPTWGERRRLDDLAIKLGCQCLIGGLLTRVESKLVTLQPAAASTPTVAQYCSVRGRSRHRQILKPGCRLRTQQRGARRAGVVVILASWMERSPRIHTFAGAQGHLDAARGGVGSVVLFLPLNIWVLRVCWDATRGAEKGDLVSIVFVNLYCF